jgi:hypothetical protein
MSLSKSYYIHSEGDGVLGDTGKADVAAMIEDWFRPKDGTKEKIVLQIHGGLVSKSNALEGAEKAFDQYSKNGLRPAFIVWESGFSETIGNNLKEIADERIFRIILKKVLKHAAGKVLAAQSGGRGILGATPVSDLEVSKELFERKAGKVPFGSSDPSAVTTDLTPAEEQAFKADLAGDLEFQEEVQAIADSASSGYSRDHYDSRGILTVTKAAASTRLSKEIVDKMVEDVKKSDSRSLSLLSTLAAIGKVLFRVVSRFVNKRDHGVYGTVVEEICRELYLSNVGAKIWNFMKQDTLDTFQPEAPDKPRAGNALLDILGKKLKDTLPKDWPEISIVAHSAGNIYACNLLEAILKRQAKGDFPAGFSFKEWILLAPACDFTLFERTMTSIDARPTKLVSGLRMFALTDELESGYWEVPVLYPNSLLYLVSGMFEYIGDAIATDLPILGMQRYFRDDKVYREEAIVRVRARFGLGTQQTQLVWSTTKGGPGRDADSEKHGEFDDPGHITMDSVIHILKNGL